MSGAYRPRRYVDGLVSVPWELMSDPRLVASDKVVACCLAHLMVVPGRYAAALPTATIGRAAGLADRGVQMCLGRLREAGWIATEPAPRPTQRTIVLLWLAPDDWAGLVPTMPKGAPAPIRARAGDTPLLPAPDGHGHGHGNGNGNGNGREGYLDHHG